MTEYKLFSKYQYGFISGRSTVLQLLTVMDKWTESIDRGECVDVAYCDFMKAFDKVSHEKLVHKLKVYNLGETYINWIKAFLSSRKQRVIVNGEKSEWRDVTSGIPQGSVLGPVLFVLYINDLPEHISENSSIFLFADDTKIFKEIRQIEDSKSLQEDIYKMNKWADTWLLKFHPEKCKVMRIGKSKADKYDYKLREDLNPMEYSQYEKDIGVVIDEKLSFGKHISEKVNKANSIMGIIRRTFDYLDKNMFRTLYTTLVRPHVEYANQVWNPFLQHQIEMLENVQRRATKLVPGLKDLSYEDRLKALQLPTLSYRRMRGDVIETYKILTNKYDEEVSGLFNDVTGTDYTSTRGHSMKMFKKRSRLNIRKFSFCRRVVDVWNSLPEEVIQADSVMSFERRLDKFWRNQPIKFNHKEKISFQSDNRIFNEEQELVPRACSGLQPEEDL